MQLFLWKSFRLCKAIWLSFFPLVFNGFSFGAKFVVSDFLLCIWNRFEKPEGLCLLYLAFFNFLSSFVKLTVITSDFSYFYSHSFSLSWPDTLPFSCNQLPKSKSWFWQLIIKLWVLNWCTGFCECFLSNFNCIPCTLLNLILYCDKNIYYWVPDRFIWFLINKTFYFLPSDLLFGSRNQSIDVLL